MCILFLRYLDDQKLEGQKWSQKAKFRVILGIIVSNLQTPECAKRPRSLAKFPKLLLGLHFTIRNGFCHSCARHYLLGGSL